MVDIRQKVAYEKAARLADAEAAKHYMSPDSLTYTKLCEYCGDIWFSPVGCSGRASLIELAEKIRSYKRDA